MLRTLRVVLLTVVALPSLLTAQVAMPSGPTPLVGSRVRVTSPRAMPRIGTLERLTADSVVFAEPGTGVVRAQRDSAVVHLSAGTRTRRLAGTALGASMGLVAGLLFPLRRDAPRCEGGDEIVCPFLGSIVAETTQHIARVAVVLLGTLVGGGTGYVVGSRPEERWVRLSDDARAP